MQVIKLFEATSNNPTTIIIDIRYRFSDFDEICVGITSGNYTNLEDTQVVFPISMLRGTPYNTGGKSFPVANRASTASVAYVHYVVDSDLPDVKINLSSAGDGVVIKTIYGIKYHGTVTPRPIDPVIYYQSGTLYDYDHIQTSLGYCTTQAQRENLYAAIKTALPAMFVQQSGNIFQYGSRWVQKRTADPAFTYWYVQQQGWHQPWCMSDISATAAEIAENDDYTAVTHTFEYMGRTWYLCAPVRQGLQNVVTTTTVRSDTGHPQGETADIASAKKMLDLYVPIFGYPSDHVEQGGDNH